MRFHCQNVLVVRRGSGARPAQVAFPGLAESDGSSEERSECSRGHTEGSGFIAAADLGQLACA